MGLIGEYGYPVIESGGRSALLNDAGVYQDAMELLQVRVAQDFLNIWASIPETLPHEQRVRRLTEALADLQVVYGQDAAAIAAEYLNVLREGQDLPMVLADPVQAERVTASVEYLLTKPDPKAMLWLTMQRYAMEPFRETVRLSAFAAGNGFARVPNAGACAFCLMLASRGAVYYSKEEALYAGRAKYSKSKRGNNPYTRPVYVDKKTGKTKKGDDNRYHNDCKCTVVEVSPTAGLPEANQILFDLWQNTFYGENKINTAATSIYDSPFVGPDGLDHRKLQSKKIEDTYGLQITAVTKSQALPVWEAALKQTPLPWLSTEQPHG